MKYMILIGLASVLTMVSAGPSQVARSVRVGVIQMRSG